MAKGGKFAGFTHQQSVEPEYPVPGSAEASDAAPMMISSPTRVRTPTPKPARKLPFSSYVSLPDHERFERLVESSGKSRVRLLSEAFTLLFKHYRC